MEASLIIIPAAVIALASLVGWGLSFWGSRRLAMWLVLFLALAGIILLIVAVRKQGLDGLEQGILAFFVLIPGAMGVALGAMIASWRASK